MLDEDFALRNVLIALPSFPAVAGRHGHHGGRVDALCRQDGKRNTRALRLHLCLFFTSASHSTPSTPTHGDALLFAFPGFFFFGRVDSRRRETRARAKITPSSPASGRDERPHHYARVMRALRRV